MARPSVRQRHAATWSAAKVLFDGIARLGALAVVFTAASYVLGIVSLVAEYRAIGAQWYVRTLSFDRVVVAGTGLTIQFVVGALLLLPGQVHFRPMSPNTLMVGEIASLAIGGVLFAVGGHLTVNIPYSNYAATGLSLAGLAFLWAAVLVIVESIARIRDGATAWPGPWHVLLYAVVFLAALAAPTVIGKDVGMGRVKQAFSNDPIVRLAGEPDRIWRLVSTAGESALVVDTSQVERWEFRVIKLDAAVQIFSLNTNLPVPKGSSTGASASDAAAAQSALRPAVSASASSSKPATGQ